MLETCTSVVVATGVVVAGAVVVGAGAVVSGVSSTIAGLARALLSATTGCDGVATLVDSKVGNTMGTAGSDTAVASSTLAGKGDVARHSFLPFATPHTQTTAFFLRTFPGTEHDTDLPRAVMVAYQILLADVFAHTTGTFETLVTWPGFVHVVPATSVALRVCDDSLLPHDTAVAANATTTTLVLKTRAKEPITATFNHPGTRQNGY